MFPWLRKNIITSSMPLSLEAQVDLAYDSCSTYVFQNKYLFGQFSGASGIEEAKNYALRDQPDQAAEALFNYFRDRVRPQLFLQHSDAKAVADSFKASPSALKELSDSTLQAMRHTFSSYLSNQQETFSGDIDWFFDFCSKSWPKIAVKELRKILSPANAACLNESPLAKYPSLDRTWELNEHYHFLTLARSYWLSKQDKYASEILIQATEWGASNPLWIGVNWLNFDTIAIRLMNWMIAVDMCLNSSAFTPRIFVKIMETMILHGAALSWHLHYDKVFSFPAAICLYIFSAHFPELRLAKRWHSLAESKLLDLIEREFGNDGLHLSGSLCAHCAALEWMLLPVLQHVANRTQTPQYLSEALRISLEALQAINGTNKVAPHIGTFCAPGFMGRQSSISEYIQTLLCLGAVIFDRDEFLCGIEHMPAEVAWWVAPTPELAAKFGSGRGDYFPEETSFYFVANGIGSVRDHWGPKSSQVIIKGCTPSAPAQDFYKAPNPKQTIPQPHCDFLSICLTVENEPFIIDAGFSTVSSSAYPYLNSFFAHSAPTLAEEIYPFKVAYLEDLNASERRYCPDDITEIHKDGYVFCSPLYRERKEGADVLLWTKRQARLTNGLVLSLGRELLFKPTEQRLIIRDTVEGDFQGQTVGFESSLLFAPHLRLIMRGDMGCKVLGEKLAARVMPFFPKGARHLHAKGVSKPSPTGWYYNYKMLPTDQIRFFSKIQQPEKIYFVIDWTGHEPQRFKKAELDSMFAERTVYSRYQG